MVSPISSSALVGVALMLRGAAFTVTLQLTLPYSVVAVTVAEPARTPFRLPVAAFTVTYFVAEEVNCTVRGVPSALTV